MIAGKIEKLKEQSEFLKMEYAELAGLLEKKKAEIMSLSAGYEKYKDNQSLRSQIETVIKQRVGEIVDLNKRIEGLKRNLKEAREVLNNLFEEAKQKSRAPEIASSPAVSAALEKAIIQKAQKPEISKPVSEAKIEAKKEVEIKSKAQPKADLYDRAASEAKAQEEYLKQISKSSKDYGAA